MQFGGCKARYGDADMLQQLLDKGGNVVFPRGTYTLGKPLIMRTATQLSCYGVVLQVEPSIPAIYIPDGLDGWSSVEGLYVNYQNANTG